MKNNLLHKMNKILGFILSSCITVIFMFIIFKEDTMESLKEQIVDIVNIEYETVYIYNEKVPSNIAKVISTGVDGTALIKDDEIDILVEMQPEIIEQGTGKQGLYQGILTGYGADCVGCTGTMYCPTKDKKWIDLYKNGPYYEDETFGRVRMVAAALEQFPCGTIMKITDNRHETFTAIVMDKGIDMERAYRKGKVHIDVAFPLEHSAGIGSYADYSGTVKFDVQRWGW